MENILLCKNHYNLKPYLDTSIWDHCIAETKMRVHFSSPKIPVFIGTNKQRHKQTIHCIRYKAQAF